MNDNSITYEELIIKYNDYSKEDLIFNLFMNNKRIEVLQNELKELKNVNSDNETLKVKCQALKLAVRHYEERLRKIETEKQKAV